MAIWAMAIWIRIFYQLVTYLSVHTAIFNMTDIKYMSFSNFQKSFQMMCSGGWAYQCKKQIQSISVSCSQLYQKPYCKTPTIFIKCFCSQKISLVQTRTSKLGASGFKAWVDIQTMLLIMSRRFVLDPKKLWSTTKRLQYS